jgi:alkyl sulfatase BDS1-like metallo-beta-lactamase superfamily hydrolase|tara:strand:+ start:67 stop:369 length:303 start_codon:yes stop_codon:yes gene_type:complete
VEKNQKCRIDLEITENYKLEMEIGTSILNQINLKCKDKNSLTLSEIASLLSSALKAQKLLKNITPKTISVPEDNEGFHRIMEMLDQMEAFKRDSPGFEFK